MADEQSGEDRTEEPTQRRLDQATERGDVAKSQELPIFLSLAALALALLIVPGTGTPATFALDMRGYLMNAHQVPDSGAGIMAAGRNGLLAALKVLALPIGLVVAAALVGSVVQHKPLWTAEPLAPKLSRLSPLAGFKRVFGVQAMVQFLKGLFKLTIVGVLACSILWSERDRLEAFVGLSAASLLPATLQLSLKVVGAILALYAIVMIADVVYQRFSWMRRQRMTKEELKRELKEQDGNPEIKAKLRQIRAQRMRQRMMAAVPTATVIVANPTHFAVALRYEAGMAAPICVAKGVDSLALRIRALAEESGVPVVENPPLARALHATSELDAEIPVEHYRAVAEVIGFVLRLKRRAS